MISWMGKKQTFFALSTTKVEYIVDILVSCEAIWLQKLLAMIFDHVLELTVIFCDNQSYVKLIENLIFHYKSMHIEIKYHFIHYLLQKGVVKLLYVSTDDHISNIFTKPLSRAEFVYFKDKLGLVQNSTLIEREC